MSFNAHDHFYCQWVSERDILSQTCLQILLHCVLKFYQPENFYNYRFYHADNNFNVRSRQCSSCKIFINYSSKVRLRCGNFTRINFFVVLSTIAKIYILFFRGWFVLSRAIKFIFSSLYSTIYVFCTCFFH